MVQDFLPSWSAPTWWLIIACAVFLIVLEGAYRIISALERQSSSERLTQLEREVEELEKRQIPLNPVGRPMLQRASSGMALESDDGTTSTIGGA